MEHLKSGHTHPVVCIDPGHDSALANPSTVDKRYYEGQQMWDLSQKLRSELESRGIEVMLTKTQVNQAVSLASRGSRSAGADIFLSMHSNAASTASPNWVLALHQVDNGCASRSAESKSLGEALGAAAAAQMGVAWKCYAVKSAADRDGNGYLDDYYGVLRSASAAGTPGIILEHGFHTNLANTLWLLEEENLDRLARAEAEAIALWFGVDGGEETQAAADGGDSLALFRAAAASALGAQEDDILAKTVTVSAVVNRRHAVVAPIQQRLRDMGYTQVGEVDGVAGPKFTAAVKAYQATGTGLVGGEITARQLTWKRLLGVA